METNKPIKISLIDEIVNMFEKGLPFEKRFSPEELKQLALEVARQALANDPSVVLTIRPEQVGVKIENNQGMVWGQRGSIEVFSPQQAKVGFLWVMGNSGEKGRLKTIQRGIDAGAKTAFADTDKIFQVLDNPNMAMFNALHNQLKSRGMKVDKFGVYFEENNLKLWMEGKKV